MADEIDDTQLPDGDSPEPTTPQDTPEDKPAAPRDALGRFLADKGLPDDGEPAQDEPKDADKGDDPPADVPADADEPDDAPPPLTEKRVRALKELGYSDEEIGELDDDRDGAWIDRASQKVSRKMSELGKLQQQLKKPDAPAETQETTGDDDLTFVAEDVLDEESMSNKLNTVLKRLKKLESAEGERSELNRVAQRDEFWGSLDAKTFPQFGTGRTRDLVEGSAEAEARNQLWAEAGAIQMGYKLTGRAISDKDALQIALDHFGKTQTLQAAKDELAAKLKDRRRGAVPPTSGRRTAADANDPDARFNKAMDAFEAEHRVKIE